MRHKKLLIILPLLLIVSFFGLRWIPSLMFMPPCRFLVEFTFRGDGRRLCQTKCVQVKEGSVRVGLKAEEVHRWMKSVRPYVAVELKDLDYRKFMVDVEDVVVKDSEGHRFKVVGAWRTRWSEASCEYRLDLDAIGFNRHVKYQPSRKWIGGPSARWKPDQRYTLSLQFPFTYEGIEHTVEIPYIACFPGWQLRTARLNAFGPPGYIRFDRRPKPGSVFRGVTLDPNAPIPLLVEALNAEDPAIRESAGRTLHKMGPKAKSAVPALLSVLRDKSGRFNGRVAGALESIEGRDWREVEREWKERGGN